MLYGRTAKGTVGEVAGKVEAAAAAQKFGVLNIIDLGEKLQAKGIEFRHECRILEVCNPQQAAKALAADLVISTVLPCRISVYEEGGQVKVATLRPTAMLGLFALPRLKPVAEEVEEAMVKIVDAACA